MILFAGWWLVSKSQAHGEERWEVPTGENKEEDGGRERKVADNPIGYIPGSFLKKYEEGALEFQDTMELEEKLV